MPHLLDQPIRTALATRHAHLAKGGALARRYPPEIAAFIATMDDGAQSSMKALSDLMAPGETTIHVGVGDFSVPPGCDVEHVLEGVQMMGENIASPNGNFPFQELTEDDAPEMLALATATKPGPFFIHTFKFGGYIGIRDGKKLVAMAGHRLQAPGFTEVSAVCTDPAYRGRGYGSFLLLTVAARIKDRGETPFLHTYATNTGAIKLYETLGFRHRAQPKITVLRRV